MVEAGAGFGARFAEFDAGGENIVGSKESGTSGVGNEHEFGSARTGLLGKSVGGVEEIFEAVDLNHSDAVKGGGKDIAVDKFAGVGGKSAKGEVVAPGFDDDDGLIESDFAGGRDKAAGVADGVDLEQDGASVGVLAEMVDEIGPIDIEHGAKGGEATEANDVLKAPIEDEAGEGGALTEEGDRAAGGHGKPEAGVEADEWIDDAKRTRTDDAGTGVA